MSERTKALLLGSYFYGYSLQIIPTTIARKTSFTALLKLAFFCGGVIQITMPFAVKFSVTLAIVLQAFRGLLAGVLMSNNMEFARKWSFGKETKIYISAIGSIAIAGVGIGPMVAGFITTRLGWKSFFFVSGSSYFLIFILLCLLITEDPLNSLLITGKEKEMFVRRITAHEESNKVDEKSQKSKTSIKEILKRVYPYSFCAFMLINTFQFYSIMTLTPFYLDQVQKAPTDLVSAVQAILGLTGAISTHVCSYIFLKLDKKLPWLQCRALMTFVPFTIRSIAFVIMAASSNLTLVIICANVGIATAGVMFSGSMITVNYELDPINAGFILSIFNSVGQTSGFLAPLVKSKVVSTTIGTPNFEEAVKKEWATYYYIIATMTFVNFAIVTLAYMVRKDEWKKHESLIIDENKNSLKFRKEDGKYVVENPVAKEE